MLRAPTAFIRRLLSCCAGTSCLVLCLPIATIDGYATAPAGTHMLDGTTSAILASIPLGGTPTAAAVDPQRGRVFVAELGLPLGPPPHPGSEPPRGPGSVQVFDSAHRRLLHTITVAGQPSELAVSERAGRIFVLCAIGPYQSRGSLTIADAATGTIVKVLKNLLVVPVPGATPNPPENSLLVVDERDNHIFLLEGGGVGMYDALSGALLAATPVGYSPSALALDAGTGHLFAADAGGQGVGPTGSCQAAPCPSTVSMIDARTARLLATTVLPDGPPAQFASHSYACAMAADGAAHRLVVVSTASTFRGDGLASVLDTRSGALLAMHDAGPTACAVRMDERSGHAFVLNRPVDAPLLPTGVTVVDAVTGAIVRTVPATVGPALLAADEQRGYIFLTGLRGAGGDIDVLDARSGAVLRRIGVASPPAALAADARTAHLFVALPPVGAATAGSLLMLDAGTGAPPGTVPVGQDPTAVATDGQTGRSFVLDSRGPSVPSDHGSSPGDVSMLDTVRGVVLRHVQVGVNPQGIAVDSRAARVIVVNQGRESSMPRQVRPIPSSVSILDARSGALLRTVPVPDALSAQLVVDERDGLATLVGTDQTFALTPTFRLTVLDTTTGQILHRTARIDGEPLAVAADSMSRPLYVGRETFGHSIAQGSVVVFDPRAGQVRRSIPLDNTIPTGMAAGNGRIFALSLDTEGVGASLVDQAQGTVVQTIPLGQPVSGLAADPATGHVFASTYPSGQGTAVTPPVQPGAISTISALSGALVMSATVGLEPVQPIVLSQIGRVFVLNTGSDSVSVLDATSGRVLSTAPIGAQPVVANPALPPDGFAPLLAGDAQAGRVVVVNGLGDSVSLLDARSGAPVAIHAP